MASSSVCPDGVWMTEEQAVKALGYQSKEALKADVDSDKLSHVYFADGRSYDVPKPFNQHRFYYVAAPGQSAAASMTVKFPKWVDVCLSLQNPEHMDGVTRMTLSKYSGRNVATTAQIADLHNELNSAGAVISPSALPGNGGSSTTANQPVVVGDDKPDKTKLEKFIGGSAGKSASGENITVTGEGQGEVYIRADGKKVRRVKKAAAAEGEIYIRPDGKKVRRIKKSVSNGATVSDSASVAGTGAVTTPRVKTLDGFLDKRKSPVGISAGSASVAGERVNGDVYIRADGKKVRRIVRSNSSRSINTSSAASVGGDVYIRADGKKVRRIVKPKVDSLSDSASVGPGAAPEAEKPKTLDNFLSEKKPQTVVPVGGSNTVGGERVEGEIYIRADGKKVRRVKKSPASVASASSSGAVGEVYIRADGKKVRRVVRPAAQTPSSDASTTSTAVSTDTSTASAVAKAGVGQSKEQAVPSGTVNGAVNTAAATGKLSGYLEKTHENAKKESGNTIAGEHVEGDIYIRADGKKVRRVKKSSAASTSSELTPSNVAGDIYIRPDGKKVRRVKKSSVGATASSAAATGKASQGGKLDTFFDKDNIPSAPVKASGGVTVSGQHVEGEIYIRPDGKKVRRVKKSSLGSNAVTTKAGDDIYVRPDGTKVRRIKKPSPNAGAAAKPGGPSALSYFLAKDAETKGSSPVESASVPGEFKPKQSALAGFLRQDKDRQASANAVPPKVSPISGLLERDKEEARKAAEAAQSHGASKPVMQTTSTPPTPSTPAVLPPAPAPKQAETQPPAVSSQAAVVTPPPVAAAKAETQPSSATEASASVETPEKDIVSPVVSSDEPLEKAAVIPSTTAENSVPAVETVSSKDAPSESKVETPAEAGSQKVQKEAPGSAESNQNQDIAAAPPAPQKQESLPPVKEPPPPSSEEVRSEPVVDLKIDTVVQELEPLDAPDFNASQNFQTLDLREISKTDREHAPPSPTQDQATVPAQTVVQPTLPQVPNVPDVEDNTVQLQDAPQWASLDFKIPEKKPTTESGNEAAAATPAPPAPAAPPPAAATPAQPAAAAPAPVTMAASALPPGSTIVDGSTPLPPEIQKIADQQRAKGEGPVAIVVVVANDGKTISSTSTLTTAADGTTSYTPISMEKFQKGNFMIQSSSVKPAEEVKKELTPPPQSNFDMKTLGALMDGDMGALLKKLEDSEKRQKKLEKQLAQAGVQIADDIPYEEAKVKITTIAKRMHEIGGSDVTHPDKEEQNKLREEYFRLEQEMEKYTAALALTDEYQAEQDNREKKWIEDNAPGNLEALKKIRRHMPVKIRHMSEAELTSTPTPNGKYIPAAMAKKFKRTNVLMLIRLNPNDIERMHPSTLENFRVTGLTLTERRAVFEHLKGIGPIWEKNKAEKMTERKWTWFNMMKNNFKENLESYNRHVEKYGPPGNHPYATRQEPDKGCPLIGKQCPLKADKLIDYDGDYGFTPEAEYEVSQVTKADAEDPGAKAEREAAELLKEKKANERADKLKKHYKGKLLQVSKANGSCEAMDESMEKMEFHQMKWVEAEMEKAKPDDNTKKKQIAAFTEALSELKLSVLQYCERSGMQVSGKKTNEDKEDIRSSVECGLAEEVYDYTEEFFKYIEDRMWELKVQDSRIKTTIEALKKDLKVLHERNKNCLKKLGVERPEKSRKLKKKKHMIEEIKKKQKEANQDAGEGAGGAAPPGPGPPMPGRGGRGGLMAAIQGRGDGDGDGGGGGRGGLMAAIQGRGGGGRGGRGGGRGGLMAAIQGRGRGGGDGGRGGGRGGLMAAIQGRGRGGGDGGGRGGGRGGLMAAIQGARGGGDGGGRGGGGRAGLMAAIAARGGGGG